MKLGRFAAGGTERIGVFKNESVTDVSHEFDSFRDALASPERANVVDGEVFDIQNVRHLPPTTERNMIYCAALNYEAHAEESDSAVPEPPLIFMKLPQTLVGHQERIRYYSLDTNEIDYEAELAAVIGKPGRRISVESALDYVVGYTILNDTSARDLQFGLTVGDDEMLDWFSGKTMTNTTPTGPHVVIDEIEDPLNLDITSRVNGETLQDDNTSRMIYSIADLVSFISSRVKLTPGDIIATGTPEGVGTFQDIKLEDGDTVEVEVDQIGNLVNQVEDVDS